MTFFSINTINTCIDIFVISIQNICCGYSLEAPPQGTFNEYPKHMFLGRNKRKYLHDTPSNPELWKNESSGETEWICRLI